MYTNCCAITSKAKINIFWIFFFTLFCRLFWCILTLFFLNPLILYSEARVCTIYIKKFWIRLACAHSDARCAWNQQLELFTRLRPEWLTSSTRNHRSSSLRGKVSRISPASRILISNLLTLSSSGGPGFNYSRRRTNVDDNVDVPYGIPNFQMQNLNIIFYTTDALMVLVNAWLLINRGPSKHQPLNLNH